MPGPETEFRRTRSQTEFGIEGPRSGGIDPSSSFRLPPDHNPARLLVRLAVRGQGNPPISLIGVGHADVPPGGFYAGKLRQQVFEVLLGELGTARVGDVFALRRPDDVICLDRVLALDKIINVR